jgi:hypothetical protein
MSRRGETKFERNPRDYYRTWDPRALPPLLRFLEPGTVFVEPCAGAGDLVDQLTAAGMTCHAKFDIEPQRFDIRRGDALDVRWRPRRGMFITNPPWRRALLLPLIRHLASQAPTWLLIDAMFLFNAGSIPLHPILRKVVGTPRLTWIEGTTDSSVDDSAWYLFDGTIPPTDHVQFYGRTA